MVLAVTAVCMFVFDLGYTNVFSGAKPRTKIRYLLNMPAQHIDYVFVGSSRTANHIATKEVEKLTHKTAINLGIEGAVLQDNLLELKLLLSRKVTMQKLFLQVDYVFENEKISYIANSEALPFIHDPVISEHLKNSLPGYNAMYYVPFYRYLVTDYRIGFRELTFSALDKKPKVDLSDGFLPLKCTAERHDQFSLPASIAQRNRALEQIVALCKKHKIELVLFCAPYCSRTQHFDYIDKLKRKYPNLYDFSRTMSDGDFCNCGHLDEQGALKFTKLLMDATEKQAK
jgi:hypothetical protein